MKILLCVLFAMVALVFIALPSVRGDDAALAGQWSGMWVGERLCFGPIEITISPTLTGATVAYHAVADDLRFRSEAIRMGNSLVLDYEDGRQRAAMLLTRRDDALLMQIGGLVEYGLLWLKE